MRGFPLQDDGPGMKEMFHDLSIEQEQQKREVNPDVKGNPYVPGTDLALAYDSGFSAAMARARSEAVRYADMYDVGSDGRNTFIILADSFIR